MKNKSNNVHLIVVTFVLLFIIGCSKKNTEINIIGEWEYIDDNGYKHIFNEGGTGQTSIGKMEKTTSNKFDMVWRLEKEILVVTEKSKGLFSTPVTHKYIISKLTNNLMVLQNQQRFEDDPVVKNI